MNEDRRRAVRSCVSVWAVLASAAPHSANANAGSAPVPCEPTWSSPGFLVIYRPGSRWLANKPLAEQPLQEHGRYMLALYRQGVLRLAGGFGDDSGGAAFIRADDLSQARGLIEADPAIKAQTLRYETHEWRLVPWKKHAQSVDR